jgi:hypothetical protein
MIKRDVSLKITTRCLIGYLVASVFGSTPVFFSVLPATTGAAIATANRAAVDNKAVFNFRLVIFFFPESKK